MSRRTLEQLLTARPRPRSAFARLLAQASNQDAWTAQLRAFLPAELNSVCEVANVRDHLLTVHIHNAAWATRFRFLVPELLPKLNALADFARVREIRVRVAPVVAIDALEPPAPSLGGRSLPDSELLTAFADTLEYGDLKGAFLRLARQAEGGDAPGTET